MSILWQCADVVISHCQRMLLFYKVMATVDWKKLEGRIFRFDVNTSTADALKATNPAIIHFTTEGNIVFNGVQFAGYNELIEDIGLALHNMTITKVDYPLKEEEVSSLPPVWKEFLIANGVEKYPLCTLGDPDGNIVNYFGQSDAASAVANNMMVSAFWWSKQDRPYAMSGIKIQGYEENVIYDYDGMIDGNHKQTGYYYLRALPQEYIVLNRATKNQFGIVKVGDGLNVTDDGIEGYRDTTNDNNGIISLASATTTSIGGVKKANLNLQSEYEFLKAVPSVTTLDEAKFAINHLRIICKTLVDKLEEAGILNH